MPDWKSVKEDFDLDPESIYLNTGFIGSPPRVVIDTLQKYSERINRRPFRMLSGKTYSKLQATLVKAAKFINADPIEENTGPDRWEIPFRGEVGLTSSTTEGLFLVANGLPIDDGGKVLMTDQEYFTSEIQWYYREQRENRKLVKKEPFFTDHSKITSDDILNWFRKKITPNTQVVTYPHIFYHTGLVMPVGEISALLSEINQNRPESEKIISLVDGVQALGALPLDMKDLGCDFYAAGCHKWLCGPRGTGILFGKKYLYERLVPSIQSFIMTFSGLLRDQERRERGMQNLRGPYAIMPGGTRSFESDWALAEAFTYQENLGKNAIETRIRYLRQILMGELKQINRLQISSPEDEKLSAGIVSFQVEGMKVKEVWKALLRREIVTRPVGPLGDPDQAVLRICTHIYNSEQELEQTLEALREILG
jgi:selenocysteine lyase/cysteine desulfurase